MSEPIVPWQPTVLAPADVAGQKAYLAVHLVGGHVGMFVLLITFALWRKGGVPRNLININFCISILLSSISSCIMVYAIVVGQAFIGNSISFGEGTVTWDWRSKPCVIQAALISASLVMTSVTTFSVVLNLWLVVNRPLSSWTLQSDKRIYYTLLALPYVLFLATFGIVYSGISHPGNWEAPTVLTVNHGLLYCSVVQISQKFVTKSAEGVYGVTENAFVLWKRVQGVYIFCVILSSVGLFLEAHILIRLRSTLALRLGTNGALRRTFLRILIFSVFRFIALVTFIWSFSARDYFNNRFSNAGFVADMFQAVVPLVAFGVFFSTTDVISFWKFKRQNDTVPGMADFYNSRSRPTSGSDLSSLTRTRPREGSFSSTDSYAEKEKAVESKYSSVVIVGPQQPEAVVVSLGRNFDAEV